MRLFLIFLLLSFMLTNCPTEGDPNLVEMTASVNPEDAGAVNPPQGTYLTGREITIETEVLDERYEFAGWSGDTTAIEDSLTFEISRDMNLIANFEIPSDELSKAFSNTVTISDSVNSMDLTFGMDANATHGYDIGIDRELPPPPPDGSFYGQFNIPDYFLAEDYRPVQNEFTNWVLEAAPDSGRTLSLNWDFSETDHVGNLTLTDDFENPSFEIDMKSETSFEITADTVSILYIISSNEDIQQ